MLKIRSLAALVTAVLIATGPRCVMAEDIGRAVGAMDTYIAMVDSGVPVTTVKNVIVSGYMKGVEDATEFVDSASDRSIQAMTKEFAGSPYEKAFQGASAEASRQILKYIILRESRMSVEVLEAAFASGDRDQVKELMVQFNSSMATFEGQNFSVGDLMRKSGVVLGYIIGGGAYTVVHIVKVPVVFTVSLVGSLAKSTWKNGREGFEKVSEKIWTGWSNSRIYKGLAGLFDFKKLFEEEYESWKQLKKKYGRPDDPFEDPPPPPANP